jgi:sugar phosphate isomerase/epimerase
MIKLAAASLSFDGFGDNNFVKTFDLAPQIGYKYIEFNCWYPSTLTPGKMRDLNERMSKTGLKAAAIHLGSFGGSNRDELTQDVCHKVRAMQCAKELGCRRISASGHGRGEAGGLDGIIESLKILAPIAEEMDVLICLENHAENNLENIDDYRRIMDIIPSRHVGINIDTGHFDAAGVDMMKLIEEFGDRVNHIHVKENKGYGKKEFTRFGEGVTDNDAIIEAMVKRGYEGFITVELSPEIGEHDGRPFTIEDIRKPYTLFSKYITDTE